jgi:hypothetical protein
MSKLKIPAALLVIGAVSLGAPAIAAPVTSLSAAAKPMTQESDRVQVRFGGWHGGWGFPAGALAGALVGAAIAAPYYGGGYYPYYDQGYGYAAPAYGYAAPAYGYAAPPFGYPAIPYGYPARYYRCRPYCGWGG